MQDIFSQDSSLISIFETHIPPPTTGLKNQDSSCEKEVKTMSDFAQIASTKFAQLGVTIAADELETPAQAALNQQTKDEEAKKLLLERNNNNQGTSEDWADSENDEDSAELGPDGMIDTEYQLGFPEEGSNPLHSTADWRNWDGGRIGGKPVWLNPLKLPPPAALTCSSCTLPLRFLLQMYCPLDEVPSAFHRALYVFACGKAECMSNCSSNSSSGSGSVRCIRVQLPLVNHIYCRNPEDLTEVQAKSPPVLSTNTGAGTVGNVAPLCELCGCNAPLRCSGCVSNFASTSAGVVATYCSKAHQKLHWATHKRCCVGPGKKSGQEKEQEQGGHPSLPNQKLHLYREYDLVVSPETLVRDNAAALESSTTIWEDAHTADQTDSETGAGADKKMTDQEDEDLLLNQSDYDSALGNKSRDKEYVSFLSRVRRGGADQVLRYCRWKDGCGPLDISATAAASNISTSVPPCSKCGAPRAFEAQIMPQLLHYLKVDKNTAVHSPDADEARYMVSTGTAPVVPLKDMVHNASDEDVDWGTIDIYTCTASCNVGEEAFGIEYTRVAAAENLAQTQAQPHVVVEGTGKNENEQEKTVDAV